jgi:hypothetical protein
MMDFRKLTVEEKYEAVIKFCKDNDHLPKYNTKDALEKKMYIFLLNKKNLLERWNKGLSNKNIFKWEQKKIHQIAKTKESLDSKLKLVLKFCQESNRFPLYTCENEDEKDIARKFSAIKIHKKNKNLTPSQEEFFSEIIKYKSNYQKSKMEKLEKVIEFCKEYDRTPKQHVENENEKRLAEFLSTMKSLEREGNITPDENELLNEIEWYAPLPKGVISDEMLNSLLTLVKTHKEVPNVDKIDNIKDKKTAKLFYKMKRLDKQEKLKTNELEVLKEINRLCKAEKVLRKR